MIEMTEALRSMANETAVGPDSLPVELLKLDDPDILEHFHSILLAVWREGEVPQQWKDATDEVLHKTKDSSNCGNNRGITLVPHTGNVLLKTVASGLSDHCEAGGIPREQQCSFRTPRSTVDMLFVMRRPQELGQQNKIPLYLSASST